MTKATKSQDQTAAIAKTEVNGNVVDYTRTYEIKELSVPVDKAEQLKKFYRIIAGDERNTVVLKLAP